MSGHPQPPGPPPPGMIKIYKRRTVQHPITGEISTQEISIQGDTMDEAREHFDALWEEGDGEAEE